MKGRYGGRHMTVYCSILPKSISLASWFEKTGSLSQKAKFKLKVIDWHNSHGNNISKTSRHFGYTRKTIKEWIKRFKDRGFKGLEDYSKRPKHLREKEIPLETVFKIKELRKKYPAWSKYKIAVILEREEKIIVSSSSVGRILKNNCLINKRVSRKRQKSALQPKNRFPKGLRINDFGDLIQIDTKFIMLPGGRKFYQFTAIDVLSKIRVLNIYSSQSSLNGLKFLRHCIDCFPFKIKAIQTDNGAPFLKYFEKECKRLKLAHYFIHPHTPKENTFVEISHGMDKKEFYQLGNVVSDLSIMQKKIKEWENIWNTFRPHQALNYLTPQQYFEKYYKKGRIPTKDYIILQA